MKTVVIVRGVPGSGKSEFAKTISDSIFEADQFFWENGKYCFDPKKLKEAHEDCFNRFKKAIEEGKPLVVVSNTFTMEWEFENYKKHAEFSGYIVFIIIMENRHNGRNDHSVPDEALRRMKERFQINL